MNITHRMVAYMGLLVVTIALVTGSASERIRAVQLSSANAELETHLHEAADEMEINAIETSTALFSYIHTGDIQYLDKKNDSADDFAAWNTKYLSLIRTKEEEELGHRIGLLYEEATRVGDQIILLVSKSKGPHTLDNNEKIDLLLNAFDAKVGEIDDLLDNKIEPLIQDRLETYHNEITDITSSANAIIFLVGLVGLIVATASGWGIAQRILNPVAILLKGTEEIGKGDLGHQIKIEGTPEFVNLGESFNKMSANLKQMTDELIDSKYEAEAAHQAKSEFLRNMTHELRTPLTHVMGFSELALSDLAERGGEENASLKEYLDTIHESGNALLALINNILKITNMEIDQSKLKEGEVDIKTIVNVVAETSKKNVAGLGKKLTTIVADNIPDTIIADENKLKLILSNLLSNAEKFTPKGGEIDLRLDIVSRKDMERFELPPQSGDNFLLFTIKDNGIGLKEEDLERIFNKFEQIDGSKTRGYGGTGLGLFLAKKLAELHNGIVKAESEGLGKGSTFSLLIPLKLKGA
ncbi:MAG: HAMP domain-containing sensor histidine kinase [Nitrospinota bacterium]|nr:HAMP domain-containing histidine kinase [Nitrospinota bacterium]